MSEQQQDLSLTATEMFDLLMTGKKIGQVSQCENDPNLIRLLNHLNVVKSRSRKIYDSCGLDFGNSVLKCEPKLSKAGQGIVVTISLALPQAPKKYASFIILDNNVNTN